MLKVKPTKYVLYFRVSTQSQGATGHGIEAQRRDINLYLNSHDGEVVEEFVEVMSGCRDDRPELQDAIALCKKDGCTLLVSKVDRLSRDVEFVARICKDKKLSLFFADSTCKTKVSNFVILHFQTFLRVGMAIKVI